MAGSPEKKTFRISEFLIPALASVLVAVISTMGTIAVGSGKLDTARRQAEAATKGAESAADAATALRVSAERSPVPVGVIVASVLSMAEFADASGDPSVWDASRSRWALADGREVVGSAYRSLTGNTRVPDLRGMFLRGASGGRGDAFADPDANRVLGSSQTWATGHPRGGLRTDSAGEHNHPGYVGGGGGAHASGIHSGPAHGATPVPAGGGHTHQVTGGDAETRPNNAAVNFFVRINP